MGLIPMNFEDTVDYQNTLSGMFDNPSGDATVSLAKHERVITLNITLANNNRVPSGAWTTKYTLKTKYKPKDTFDVAAVNSGGVPNGWARVSADGRIMYYHSTGTDQQYSFSATYISNE